MSPSAAAASWRSAPSAYSASGALGAEAKRDGRELEDGDRQLSPACVNACPTDTLVFGNIADPDSKVSKLKEKEMSEEGRGYHLLDSLGTGPNVIYLKKVDEKASEPAHA